MKTDNHRPSPAINAARTLHRILRSVLMPAIYLLALAGCNNNSECIEEQEANDVWMTFNIRNLTETPARDLADPIHADEEAAAAENYINCADYDLAVMFLNNEGKVLKVFNKNEFVILNESAGNLNRDYKMMLHINKDYLPAGDEVTFSLLVIANLNGTGTSSNYDLNWMASISELSALKKSFGYNGTSGSDPWTPDITAKRLIPMAGIRQFTVPRATLLAANVKKSELDLSQTGGNIEMQRAMAKIRVIDELEANGYSNNEIISVTLTGMNTKGAYIPSVSNLAWGNPNTAVCHTAIADPDWYDAATEIPSYALSLNGKNGRGFYIPEFSWNSAPAGADPALNITVKTKSTGETKTYRYPLSKTLKANSIIDMTRNHVYEFVVTEIANTEMNLTLNVKDWADVETVWDYTDNPGLATGGAIKFDSNTCEINVQNAEVVFRNDKADIKAEFTLAAPVNATWHAVFIHESGTQGAFVFVDEHGEEKESVSGNIDGVTPARLTIRTKDTPVTENNVKRLQIIVSMVDGRSVTANVLTGGGYGGEKTYITLIQNHQIQ